MWKQTYPRDRVPYNDLGHVYSAFGQYDKSVEEASEALRLEPNTQANYSNLARYYLSLNRLDEAEAVLKNAQERKLEGRDLVWIRYEVAFVKGDEGEMKRLVEQAAGKPGLEDLLLDFQADTETYYGRLAKARELRRRAVDLAKDNDATEAAAIYLGDASLEEAYSGETKQARSDADEALRLASNRAVRGDAALALALVGDTTRAEKLEDEFNQSFPLDTRVQRYWLPTIRAVLALEGPEAFPIKASDNPARSRSVMLGHLQKAGRYRPARADPACAAISTAEAVCNPRKAARSHRPRIFCCW